MQRHISQTGSLEGTDQLQTAALDELHMPAIVQGGTAVRSAAPEFIREHALHAIDAAAILGQLVRRSQASIVEIMVGEQRAGMTIETARLTDK